MIGTASSYNVIIIGAGSSGCVVAARLTEDPSCNLCLIEAGEWPTDPDIADPLKWPALQGRPYDWDYRTTPQPHTASRVHDWARGRLVGGSSCLHAMAYVRGHPDDFDAWEEAGGKRWSFEGLLPGFIKSEAFSGGATPGRGTEGPLDVYLPDAEVSPVARAYMAAGRALGVPSIGDHNSGELVGTAPNSLNIRDGRRLSVADAYLTEEVLARPNLTILTGSRVRKIEFDTKRATSITVVRNGQERRLSSDRILLAAGAIETPLLLMRSGIGDPAVLNRIGIETMVASPEVGRNLQDHLLLLGNVYRSNKPVPPSRLQHSESLMYLHSDDLSRATGSPDIVLAFVVAPTIVPGLDAPPYGEAFTLLCGVTHPTSRGTVLPTGGGLDDPPLIDPHYLETAYDRDTFRAALKTARLVANQAPLDEWRAEEALPGAETMADTDLDAFIARAASTHHHPCGTCRMGDDDTAVVDPDLRVNGVENLFVIDASIIPRIPSGPIHAAVIAVAETWAALSPDIR